MSTVQSSKKTGFWNIGFTVRRGWNSLVNRLPRPRYWMLPFTLGTAYVAMAVTLLTLVPFGVAPLMAATLLVVLAGKMYKEVRDSYRFRQRFASQSTESSTAQVGRDLAGGNLVYYNQQQPQLQAPAAMNRHEALVAVEAQPESQRNTGFSPKTYS